MNLLVVKNAYFDDHILLCFKDFLDSLSFYNDSKYGFNIKSIYSEDISSNFNVFNDIDWVILVGIDSNISLMRKKIDSKFAVFWDDIHYHTQEALNNRKKMFETSDVILLPYYKQFLKREEYKKFWDKSVFFPWFAPKICLENHIDFELRKDTLLMSGRVSDSYGFRKKMYENYFDDKDFEFLEHPGYNRRNRKHDVIREEYYKYLSNYKTAVVSTANSPLLDYTVAKYFEIPACGCSLILQETPDIKNLGFIENEHYININEDNFKNIKNIVKEFDLKKMSDKSLELIKQKHLVENRIELLFEILKWKS